MPCTPSKSTSGPHYPFSTPPPQVLTPHVHSGLPRTCSACTLKQRLLNKIPLFFLNLMCSACLLHTHPIRRAGEAWWHATTPLPALQQAAWATDPPVPPTFLSGWDRNQPLHTKPGRCSQHRSQGHAQKDLEAAHSTPSTWRSWWGSVTRGCGAPLPPPRPTPVDLTVPLPGLSRVSGPRLPADFSAGPRDNSQPHGQSVSLALS